jgi:hypothetical protein
MPKYWMINDRSQGGVGPDVSTDGMTYWVNLRTFNQPEPGGQIRDVIQDNDGILSSAH